MGKRKFKDLFNEIGTKYSKLGIDNIIRDYNALCLISLILNEINDEDIKDELENVIGDIKSKLENQEIEIKGD